MMKIGIIGPGKVGQAMAAYCRNKGMNVLGIYGRSDQKTSQAAKQLQMKQYQSLSELVELADLIFVTVSDQAIPSVSKQIADGRNLTGKFVFHCSGALSSEVLGECMKSGAVTGSIHPLKAFAGGKEDVTSLESAYLTAESQAGREPAVDAMLKKLGNPYRWIPPSAKSLYHGAAVVMSNYMVTLVEEGLTYLREAGFDDDTSLSMMMPLMRGTLSNIESKGTVDGLTGPLVRNDQEVIHAHMASVSQHLGEDAEKLYRHLGRKTVAMVQGRRMDDATAKGLSELLKER